MKPMYRRILIVTSIILVSIILFHRFGFPKYLTLEYIKQKAVNFEQRVSDNYLWAVICYMATCTFLTTIAVPITGLCAMVGGFAFGIFPGLLYTTTAMTIGSVAYVFLAQNLLANVLETRYVKQLERFNQQVEQYGYSYLVSLHLLVILPFFLINSLAALAHVPLYAVAWTTAVGVIPGTFLYILAGKELEVISTTEGIFKPQIVILLAILACIAMLPMLMKYLQRRISKS